MPHPTEQPKLKPVPMDKDDLPEDMNEGPFRYCRMKGKNKLLVIIENHGADMPAAPQFKVEVDFGQHGSQKKEWKGLKGGQRTEFDFDLSRDFFDPDCEFDINIYVKDELHRQTSGLCPGELH